MEQRGDPTYQPPAAPAGWKMTRRTADGAAYDHLIAPRRVILSRAWESDGRLWVHFSMSCASRLPRWDEFVAAKEAFLGPESKAIQVVAPRSQWVNIHPYVLHLFVCETGDGLPDFTGGSGSL